MTPLTSSSSIQQYVIYLHQQMMDRGSLPVELGYAAEAEVSPGQPQVDQPLRVEIALSRQFRRVS
jgi:hypothetical protein